MSEKFPFQDTEVFNAIDGHRAACAGARAKCSQPAVPECTSPDQIMTTGAGANAGKADALTRLLAVKPRTMSGLIALLAYMAEARRRDPSILDNDRAVIFATTVSDSASALANFGDVEPTRDYWLID